MEGVDKSVHTFLVSKLLFTERQTFSFGTYLYSQVRLIGSPDRSIQSCFPEMPKQISLLSLHRNVKGKKSYNYKNPWKERPGLS